MNQNINFNEVFDQVLSGLNEDQLKAVRHTEGPVLVVAGPGTGKTQLLAARVGYILKTSQVNPENILCLTFTDAGSINMRARITEFIGPVSYRIPIFTFHAFCNMVIQENLDYFGLRELDLVDEVEEIELIQAIIDSFSADNPLKRYGHSPYFDTQNLKKLFTTMKKEGWTPDFIKKKAAAYLEDLPNREEFIYKRKYKNFQKGDLRVAAFEKEEKKMAKLIAAVDEFDNYEQKLRERNRYTYEDMILWVMNAFRKEEHVLLRYQERYQYFLVDEYQDTNGSQNELLNLLIGFWDVPNVFVVGDDDQSIFRFQGANFTNILDFKNKYSKGLQTIVLKNNYRSSANILAAAAHLIASNNERLVNDPSLDIHKKLRASLPAVADSKVKPEIRAYINTSHETVAIATEIEKLQKTGEQLSDIAVIYRKHAQAEEIARYLEQKDIPLNIARKFNILDSPFIRKIRTLLEYLNTESKYPGSGNNLLFEILHFDWFGIDGLAIDTMFAGMYLRRNHRQKLKCRKAIRQPESFIETGLFSSFNDSINKIKSVSALVEKWLTELRNTTLQRLFESIINEGGILRYVMQSGKQADLLQELTTFYNLIKTETLKNPKGGLAGLINHLRLRESYKVPVQIERFVYSGDGVNMLTAHAAKGLEFKYVFIIGCQESAWKHDNRTQEFRFPDNITNQPAGDQTEESRRLFYVAMTRAKEYLTMSYSISDNGGKKHEPSRFLEELKQHQGLELKEIALNDSQMVDYHATILQMPKAGVPLIDNAYLNKLLEKYSLSVTHLSTYLKCPLSFYYKNLLKIPAAKSVAMTFGSAVHVALEEYFKQMRNAESEAFPPVAELLASFDRYMFKHADAFTEQEFELKTEYAHKILPEYVKHYLNHWNKVVAIERVISQVEIDGANINGKIDKIEFDGSKCNVVDYKTGNSNNSNLNKKFMRPSDTSNDEGDYIGKYGGDYWRQAVFYKILIDNDKKNNWTVTSSEFDFIEPNEKGGFTKRKVEIAMEDISIVRQQIRDTYNGIMSKSFDGCGKDDCEWCNWAKDNFEGSPAAFSEVQTT